MKVTIQRVLHFFLGMLLVAIFGIMNIFTQDVASASSAVYNVSDSIDSTFLFVSSDYEFIVSPDKYDLKIDKDEVVAVPLDGFDIEYSIKSTSAVDDTTINPNHGRIGYYAHYLRR